jgi:hypothetical protein
MALHTHTEYDDERQVAVRFPLNDHKVSSAATNREELSQSYMAPTLFSAVIQVPTAYTATRRKTNVANTKLRCPSLQEFQKDIAITTVTILNMIDTKARGTVIADIKLRNMVERSAVSFTIMMEST